MLERGYHGRFGGAYIPEILVATFDELEQAFSGKKTAQAAMDSAVERGNRLLHQFERASPDR